MPKPLLNEEFGALEADLFTTFLAGHHEWRPDLPYPESASDMSGGLRELMRQFEIKRRTEPIPVQHMLRSDEQGCKCTYCQKGAAESEAARKEKA